MKQLLTILLLFPLFIACSSDDDNDDYYDPQLFGTWVEPGLGYKLQIEDRKDKESHYVIYHYELGSVWFNWTGRNQISIMGRSKVTYEINGNNLKWHTSTGLVEFIRQK